MEYDGDNTGEGRLGGCSEVVIVGDGSLEKSETVEKQAEFGVAMEVASPLLLRDTLVMVCDVEEVEIAGRVARIEGGDRVGEVMLCKPRTEMGAV